MRVCFAMFVLLQTLVVTVGDTRASWGHLRQQSCDNFILKLSWPVRF